VGDKHKIFVEAKAELQRHNYGVTFVDRGVPVALAGMAPLFRS
jgi:hypothetical protein